MRFIRTVLGDIAPQELGVCYAHEHIIIDESFTTVLFPDFLLNSVEKGTVELNQFHADGGRAMIDSMPCDSGRRVDKLAAISRGSGVHIVCPTGLHLAKYYEPGHWGKHYSEEQLAQLFRDDIEIGVDRFDYSGPIVERTEHKAGLIKIASGLNEVSDHEKRIFRAAAEAHKATGCPILTHTEQGTAGLQQVEFLRDAGVNLGHLVLSHLDRKPDIGYHREILSTGVRVEYDSAFRWKEGNPTRDLVLALIEEFPDQIMLGMDAARFAYWNSYGGKPGMSYLLTVFTRELREAGLTDAQWQRIFVSTPSRAFSFAAKGA